MAEDLPQLTWEEKWVAVDYVELVFEPVNLAILFFVCACVYFGKVLYAAPYVISDVFHAKKNKEARAKRRREHREATAKARATRGRGSGAAVVGGAGAGVGAGAGAGGDASGASTDGVELTSVTLEEGGGSARAEDLSLLQADATRVKASPRPSGLGWLEWELVSNDNPAVAVSFTSFIAAICIVLTGPRTPANPDDEFFTQLFDMVIWSSLGIIFLGIANIVCRRVLLFGLLDSESLFHANMATAMVESGSYIGSSFVIRASLTGDSSSNDFGAALGAATVYFVGGQLLLVVSVVLLQLLTKYDDQAEARKGNFAAGIKMFGTLVSMGLIIANPVLKTDSLLVFGLFFVFGTIVQTVLRQFIDRLLIPGRPIDTEIEKDQNWGLALVEAAITISIALALGSFLPDLSCKTVNINVAA